METVKYVIENDAFIMYKRRRLAQKKVATAVRSGELIRPRECELCSFDGPLSAHHSDYGQPLKVIWVCDACHGKVHSKNHPLNPDNHEQTPDDVVLESGEQVSICMALPAMNLIELKRLSAEMNVPVSMLIRDCVRKQYPFGIRKKLLEEYNDNTREKRQQGVSSMVANDAVLSESELPRVSCSGWEGSVDRSGVARFYSFSTGHGADARRMQCAGSA